VRVAKGAGNGFDEAALRALRAYKSPIKDAAGEHSIAIVFCVVKNESRPVVSEDLKKDGYVGELAISDNMKSRFKMSAAKLYPSGTVIKTIGQ
ncbi:MAG: hypothetical protein ABJA76_08510, partial [Mucilaginibacter sp.]